MQLSLKYETSLNEKFVNPMQFCTISKNLLRYYLLFLLHLLHSLHKPKIESLKPLSPPSSQLIRSLALLILRSKNAQVNPDK